MTLRNRTNTVLTLAAATMLTVTFTGPAQAALIYESFSQPAGDLNGQASSGIGLSGNWADDQTVTVVDTPTMSYGDLQNAGGQVNMGPGNGTDAWVTTNSALSDNNLLDNGATLWFSYMFEKASGGGSNEHSGFALGTDRLGAAFNGTRMLNGGSGVGVYSRNSSVQVATWSGTGSGTTNSSNGSGISFGYSTSVLVVGEIQWGATAGDDEAITIYVVDPTDLATLGTGVSKTVAGFDQTTLDTISFTLRNAGTPGTQIYDEIRFGATQADVTPVQAPGIPEPTSLALLGLGLLSVNFLGWRRRRR